jgi:hypothetical protein
MGFNTKMLENLSTPCGYVPGNPHNMSICILLLVVSNLRDMFSHIDMG